MFFNTSKQPTISIWIYIGLQIYAYVTRQSMTFYLQKWIILKYDTGLSDMTGEPGCTLSWYPFDRMKQENLRLCLIMWENKSTFFYRALSRVTKKINQQNHTKWNNKSTDSQLPSNETGFFCFVSNIRKNCSNGSKK